MAYTIQLLIPAPPPAGEALRESHAQVRTELIERFEGLTVYSRAPARGLWKDGEDRSVRDDIVIYEVMCETLDAEWWDAYRQRLERRFDQQQLVIRAQETRLL